MAGIGKYKKGAKFTLRSGNTPEFKMVGSSPIMHYVNDVPEHNDGHPDDLQTPEEHDAWRKKKSPATQKVDPDAPGTPGKPGYEPPVKREDLDAKGKAIWDKHRAKDKYWYKINNKAATKAQYMAYKNKPGGDEPGKQTNDPTVSLAKQSADKRK